MTIRDRAKSAFYIYPSLLLVVVAFYQYYRVLMHHLDPWKGGGFGMFSSMNSLDKHRLSITLVMTDGQVKQFPLDKIMNGFSSVGEVARLRRELVVEPSFERLKHIASILSSIEWVAVRRSVPVSDIRSENSEDAVSFHPRSHVSPDVEARPVFLEEVCVEMFEYNYDCGEKQLTLHRLMSVTELARNSQQRLAPNKIESR